MSMVCRSIGFFYGDHKVLEDVSFQVERGVFCALLGSNGSGKTTLLRCMGGLLRPGRGNITLGGLDLASASRNEIARRVAVVPQEHTDIFPFRVLDVVVMGRTPFLRVNQRPGPEDYRMASEALEIMDAAHLAERNFNKISGGERQIVLLARALLQSGENLLLDEPTNHLDFNHQYLLLGRIKGICRARGARVVAAMHDPNLAYLYADQVVMLREGRVLASGPARQVMTAERVSELYRTDTRRLEVDGDLAVFIPRHLGRWSQP